MDWITDRLPTEVDGDCDGDVAVKPLPGSDAFAYLYWSLVKPGMAWRRTSHWSTPEPAAPEPAASTPQPRRIVSITRTVWMDQGGSQCHTIDAVADDGTAWWKVPGETEWTQLPALPDRG